MAKPKRNRSRSKIKIEKQVQDLKASIAEKSGTDEERSIEHAENMADILDGMQCARRLFDDLHHRIILSPYAAKRLQDLITKLVQEHEARYGALR